VASHFFVLGWVARVTAISAQICRWGFTKWRSTGYSHQFDLQPDAERVPRRKCALKSLLEELLGRRWSGYRGLPAIRSPTNHCGHWIFCGNAGLPGIPSIFPVRHDYFGFRVPPVPPIPLKLKKAICCGSSLWTTPKIGGCLYRFCGRGLFSPGSPTLCFAYLFDTPLDWWQPAAVFYSAPFGR